MFDSAVERVPERVALQYFDGQLTYREVDELVGTLASFLVRQGIGRGDRVAVNLQSSPHFVVTALAVWRAGCIVVPVNPMYRSDEVARLLRDCEAAAVVCSHRAYIEAVEPGLTDTVRILITTSEKDFQSADDPRVFGDRERTNAPSPGTHDFAEIVGSAPVAETGARTATKMGDVAVICYTSGTSGPPKGAMLTHQNLAVDVAATAEWLQLADGARLFALAPLFHVTGLVVELAHSLCLAGTLILPYRFDPVVALELFEKHRPHFTVGPPTAYSALMASPTATADAFSSFEVLLSGGAPLPPAIVDEFETRFGKYIANGYGLTETSAACVLMPLGHRAPIDEPTRALANGVPLPGVDVMVVADDGTPAGIGERGEILVRGDVVFQGYWQRPTETESAFTDGWFRTGDVGLFDADHLLFVVDRIKDMIIASGFKVWPGEVEHVLYQHPAVRDAAVVGVKDAYRGETVQAFVTLDAAAQVEEKELVAWCRSKLAAFKVPRSIVVVDALPTTASGKILRRALR